MIIDCKHPVLIVEGLGDKAAVPRLIRDTYGLNQIYDVNPTPRPKLNVDVRKLRRQGELERYVSYASQDNGDSILVVLDCEDVEPQQVFADFCPRIEKLQLDKKVGIVLFKSEFEALFLFCLPEIAHRFPEYEWIQARLTPPNQPENIRNAKGLISSAMRRRAYKETRDQVKFITGLDWDKLRARSASFVRFEETLLWLAGQKLLGEAVYPCAKAGE